MTIDCIARLGARARVAGFAALLVVLLGQPRLACAQESVSDFSAGQPSGSYTFNSRTPKSFPDLLRDGAAGEVTPILGHLFLPPGADKVPAVIFMHGSGGLYEAMLDYWPKQFNAAGYALLALDTFGPRGVKNTAEDQSQVPFAADVADVYAALRLLASHPRIDAGRIALLGTSRGGIATWRAALNRVIEAQKLPNVPNVPEGLRFAAFIPVYSGGCVGAFRVKVQPGVFTTAPQLWVHGDADDYAIMAPCQDYAQRIGQAGTPVVFEVIPGAAHKFDGEPQRRIVLRSAQTTKADCPLEIDVQTLITYDRFTGARLQGDTLRDVTRNSCSSLGASVEGNHAARDKAAAVVTAFLRKTFGR
jgi:dienelactone hydrolase